MFIAIVLAGYPSKLGVSFIYNERTVISVMTELDGGYPEHYDLGIKDYLIGGGLWVVGLLTKQMGHEHIPPAPELPIEPVIEAKV